MTVEVIAGPSEVEQALAAARAKLVHAEDADYSGNNPRRASKEAQALHKARTDVRFWEWAVEMEPRARAAGLQLRADTTGLSPSMKIVGRDGRLWSTGKAGFDELLADIADDTRYALLVAKTDAATALRPIPLGELRQILVGTSRNRFTAFVLDAQGYANEDGLTPKGQQTGYFIERNGEYGPYYLATYEGVTWIYGLYMAGQLPMTKGAIPKAVPEYEERLKNHGH